MQNKLCLLALTLCLCSVVLNEEVFESYTSLSEPTSGIYGLDITTNGQTLVVSSDDKKNYIYSISGITITNSQTISNFQAFNRGGKISDDGQTIITSHKNVGKVHKLNSGTGQYDLFQTLTGGLFTQYSCISPDAEFVAIGGNT